MGHERTTRTERPDSVTDLPVLKCFACDGPRSEFYCPKCERTGSIFWVGRAFPYTPEGEKRALAFLRSETVTESDANPAKVLL